MRKINLKSEKNYENKKVLDSEIRKNQDKFYWSCYLNINKHEKNTFKVIKNKSVLEIGCSSGEAAKKYTNYSRSFIGIDISDKAIEYANSLNLKKAKFLCQDAHKLPLKNSSIDCVIVNSLLHHLDLNTILKEIHRVLKTNGMLVFREPLGINPFFKLYRYLTPNARTVDEKPFDIEDINIMRKYFYFKKVEWYGFLNIFSAFTKIKSLRNLLGFIDKILSFTPLKYYFWQISGIVFKRENFD